MSPDVRLSRVVMHDRLYGKYYVNSESLQRRQTREYARLTDVSHSATPARAIPTSTPASKVEHSLGVSHLATIAVRDQHLAPFAREIIAACDAHDLGTPPFSHVSERFMEDQLGVPTCAKRAKLVLQREFFY